MNIILLAMRLLKNQDILARVKELLPDEPPPEQANGHPVGSVEWLQESLNILMYDVNLTVDGIYGEKTQQAVADYQMEQGLAVDGWAGPETVNSIVEQLSA